MSDPNDPDQRGWGSPGPSGQPPSGQPQYGQPPFGQPQYGQPQYGQPQYGQPQYGQPQYGQPHAGPFGQYGVGPVPFDQPLYGAGIGAAVRRYWRKYATFSGRASRAEFWWMVLVNFIIGLVIGIATLLILLGSRGFSFEALVSLSARPAAAQIPGDIWLLATIVPNSSLAIRRLHDSNRSGWFYLLIVPYYAYTAWQQISPPTVPTFDPQNPPSTADLLLPLLVVVPLLIAVPLLVFYLMGPNPAGRRFDASRPAAPQP